MAIHKTGMIVPNNVRCEFRSVKHNLMVVHRVIVKALVHGSTHSLMARRTNAAWPTCGITDTGHAMLASLISDIPLEALVIRMLATAFVVMAVSWAVGAFGPLIGGALAGLPIILGPGFYFLALQEPAPFVAQAATYALLSLCATQFFLLTYIATAHRGKPLASLGCAIATWLLVTPLFQLLPARPMVGILLFVVATGVCLHLGARFTVPALPVKGQAGFGLLFVRGILAGGLVAVATTASHWLGSTGAGLLLGFPIGYTVVAVTIHQKHGVSSVIATLHSALLGTASLAGFCTALALAIPHWTSDVALGIALATAMLITVSLIFRQRILAMLR